MGEDISSDGGAPDYFNNGQRTTDKRRYVIALLLNSPYVQHPSFIAITVY